MLQFNPSGTLLSLIKRDMFPVDTDLNSNRWVFFQVFDPYLIVLGTMNFLRRLTFERPQKGPACETVPTDIIMPVYYFGDTPL
jgi:hypothetical protein